MSKKRMAWVALPVLILLCPWPAWLWWSQQTWPRDLWPVSRDVDGIGDWQPNAVASTGDTMEADPERAGREPVARTGRDAEGADVSAEVLEADPERAMDTVFARELFAAGGLEERVDRLAPWANAEQRALLATDWVEALSLLRFQHRMAKEAGGMQMALIGAPGDLLFSLMPDLGVEIDTGRATLRPPKKPGLDPEFGTATARFGLEPTKKTLLVEVATRFGTYDLELGRDCGEPDLRAALWKESGLLWRAFLK